jgi:GNAT superfamily N-acetyltransferase
MRNDVATTNTDAICRTAIDSLQAKYAACHAFGPITNVTSSNTGRPNRNRHHHHHHRHLDDDDNGDQDDVTDTASTTITTTTTTNYQTSISSSSHAFYFYTYLLRQMTGFCIGPRRQPQQTSLLNIAYRTRIACVQHQLHSFMTFHRYNNLGKNENDNHGFMNETENPKQRQSIQIIILGCGLDVTGLWSLSHANSNNNNNDDTTITDYSLSSSSLDIHVLEIDFASVCTEKVRAIQSLQLLNDLKESSSSTGAYKVWQGTYQQSIHARYTIVSADLQDQALIRDIVTGSKLLDPTIPTLILSELVVSYLPTDSCDSLLQHLHTYFQQYGSCILLYEPLGPCVPLLQPQSSQPQDEDDDGVGTNETTTTTTTTSLETSTVPLSILESYQALYSTNFNAKLQRGYAKRMNHQNKEINDTCCNTNIEDSCINQLQRFHPFASTATDVIHRLQRLGYKYVNVITAGFMASFMERYYKTNTTNFSTTNELFDEHATLILHLRTYATVTAFPTSSLSHNTTTNTASNNNTEDKDLFRQYMCPWMYRTSLVPYPTPIRIARETNNSTTNSLVWIRSIQQRDEKQVRQLFQDTYQQLCAVHVSIRKMVKMALRNDLGVNTGVLEHAMSSNDNPTSTIGTTYTKQGGDFIVVVTYNHHEDKFDDTLGEQSESNPVNSDALVSRDVMGGCGIRKCTNEECVARFIPSFVVCYEIHRFFVNAQYRGCGIGSSLWHTILAALIQRHTQQRRRRQQQHRSNGTYPETATIPPPPPPLFYVTATTPTLLIEANRFYVQHGFQIHNSIELGDLTMITYIKAIFVDDAAVNVVGNLR